MKKNKWNILNSDLIKGYESATILVLVVLIILFADFLFYHLVFNPFIKANINDPAKLLEGGDWIEFAPEAWLSLLGLVLGTLIIVISVASQSTPKLIDLYTGDKTSLWYIWYIIVGSVHNMLLQIGTLNQQKESETLMSTLSNACLNTYLMLPLALLLAVPYVLYILRYTKTSNVIEKIYQSNIQRMFRLQRKAKNGSLRDDRVRYRYQFELFEALNQLDDLLEYVSFKEPKGDIMNKISLSIQTYISLKTDIKAHCASFFEISTKIRQDVSFKTMIGQFKEMEETATFYEQKGFRLLGNAYIKLIEDEEFDLASLCAFELSECGRIAIDYKDDALVSVVLIRFNTLIRFGIKHGLKNREARNLYNAIFHYTEFIRYIVAYKNEKLIDKSCGYLNFYINEIYGYSRKEKPFGFLVDVFTWEFKRILMEMSKEQLPIQLQKKILGYFLKIDNLSEKHEEPPIKGQNFSNNIRGLQIALALYYLKYDQEDLARSIVTDILSDHESMGKDALKVAINNTCHSLDTQQRNFFEDTDRGNMNIYYTEDKDAIPVFKELFGEMINEFSVITRNIKPPGKMTSPEL